ncbi:MAG: 4Fe-4S ferredoxin [Candidatus Baldrarchaeia archaeon]
MKLLRINAGDRRAKEKGKLLIYGECVKDMWPQIFKNFLKDHFAVAVCLEAEHMNMVAFKLATMIKNIKPNQVTVLTVDGSPHCVQLHMTVEEVRKIVENLSPQTNYKYYVINKGELIEVPRKCIKTSRYLSKIKKLLEIKEGS